jgi:Flp pilus assembly pilin Flp
MIEYALLAALIAIVCIIGITFLGQQTSTSFSESGAGFCPAFPGSPGC